MFTHRANPDVVLECPSCPLSIERADGRTPDKGAIRTNRTETGRETDTKRTPLSVRVRAMSDRWRYTPDELAAALAMAEKDPAVWLRIVEADEQDREQTETPDRGTLIPSLSGVPDMLTVTATASSSFEMPPAGPVAARCSRLIDLGSQKGEFQGKATLKRKLLLTWELAEARADGTPHQISRRFTLSLDEKASLRQFLQAWRGRPFTDEELAGFDLRKLMNAPAMLNIGHTQRDGKSYANILSVSPLPKGMTAPDLSAAPFAFDIDAPDAPDLIETLSDNLQATIAASPEWQARVKGGGADDAAPFDDDIAF